MVTPLTVGRSRADLLEGLGALQRAKVDVSSAFAINSLVWMLLKTRGVDPKDTDAKAEVDRVRAAIQRLKEVEVRAARPTRVDAEAAKRFVKSGLWTPEQDKDKRKRPEGGRGRGGGGGGRGAHSASKRARR